jgi:pimeloyl-ACP methyl ester carboxylesterase
MATFVLAHGSWHGGWCWRKLTPVLREHGHDVHTPTFTGMGERYHLLSDDASVATHVRDLVQVIIYQDLHDVILVGHSYAGSIITAAVDEVADRIARLVYLDAFIPRDGDSLFSMRPPSFAEYFLDRAQTEGDGRLLPPFPPQDYGITDPDDIVWMSSRLVPVLLSTFSDPVHLPQGIAEQMPRTYIYCTEYGFDPEAERARSEGWEYHELPTSHDAMVTMPRELADILLSAAARLTGGTAVSTDR